MDSMDLLAGIGVIGLVILILCILFIELVAIILVAGFLASWLGFSGLLWWAVAIVLFLLINGILSALVRK